MNATVIRKVDTGRPANQYGRWTACSRRTNTIEQGRRIENLSWRLWQRKTFVADEEDKTAPTTDSLSQNIPSGLPSPAKSITASEGSRQPSPQSLPCTAVVRGFSPSQIPTPRTISGAAQSSEAIPEPKSSPAAKVVHSMKAAGFALGSSCSASERDQSLSNSKPGIPIIKKPVFQIGGSSEEDGSLKSAMASSRPGLLLSARKKQTSFSNNILWERQDKSSTANAVLKRLHTSHDVANLRQYPEKPCMKKSEDVNASSWIQYFSRHASDGYHSTGW